MQQRKTTKVNATALTNHGLIVGVPLLISLVFSGIYAITQQSTTSQVTSSKQKMQSAAQPKNVQVTTPQPASKLNAEAPAPTTLDSTTATQANRTTTNQAQPNADAATNAQKSAQHATQQASKESLLKLQNKADL